MQSDPFFEIAKSQEGGVFTEVYRSDPKMKTLDPQWPSFSLSIQRLCSGDWDRVMKFTIWDWNKSVSILVWIILPLEAVRMSSNF